MKYTFTRKQIVNAFNNKILDDDNFLTYLLSTTSKDRPMNQKSLDKKKTKELECKLCKRIQLKKGDLKGLVYFCKRHRKFGGMTISKITLYTEEQVKNKLIQQRTELLEEIKDLQTYVLFNDTEKLISLEQVINLLNKKDE